MQTDDPSLANLAKQVEVLAHSRERYSNIGLLIERLVLRGISMTITHYPGQYEDGISFAVILHEPRNSARRIEGRDLKDIFEVLAFDNRTRRCSNCGKVKTYEQFSRLERGHNGRNHSCKDCEKQRANAWKKRHRRPAPESPDARGPRPRPDGSA